MILNFQCPRLLAGKDVYKRQAQTLLNPGQVLNRFEGTNSREQMLRRLTQLVKMVGIVRPDKVFIGQCDAQFLACVRQVVRDLSLIHIYGYSWFYRKRKSHRISRSGVRILPYD